MGQVEIRTGLDFFLTDLHNPVPQVDTKNLTTDQVKAWVIDDLFSRSVMIEKYRKNQVVISVRMAEDGLVYADVTVPSDPNFEPRNWSYRINSRGRRKPVSMIQIRTRGCQLVCCPTLLSGKQCELRRLRNSAFSFSKICYNTLMEENDIVYGVHAVVESLSNTGNKLYIQDDLRGKM